MKLDILCVFGLVTMLSASPFPRNEENADVEDPDLLSQTHIASGKLSLDAKDNPVILKTVFQADHLNSIIASYTGFEDLLALYSVSKCWLKPVQKALSLYYLTDGKMNWAQLFKDIREFSPAQRPALVQFLLDHWPRAEEGLVAGLSIHALQLLKELFANPKGKPQAALYIPGHFTLCHAVNEACKLENAPFPIEAFYHEDADIAVKHGSWMHSYHNIKALLNSGNDKAISNFLSLFPVKSIEMNTNFSVAGLKDMEPRTHALMAISLYYGQNREALLKYLSAMLNALRGSGHESFVIGALMDSTMSTSDILLLAGDRFEVDRTFRNYNRLVEVLSLQGFGSLKVDFGQLLEEQFRGEHSRELCFYMGMCLFSIVGTLAGADEDLLKEPDARFFGMLAPDLLLPAILAGKSTEFFEYLLSNIHPNDLINRVSVHDLVPPQYLACLFKIDSFAIAYSQKFFTCIADQDRIREIVNLLSSEQLETMLNYGLESATELSRVVFFDELLKQHGTGKIQVIEKYLSKFCDKPAFHIALCSQSLETLDQIYNEATSQCLEDAVRAAIIAKMAL